MNLTMYNKFLFKSSTEVSYQECKSGSYVTDVSKDLFSHAIKKK